MTIVTERDNRGEMLSREITEWVMESSGWFSSTQLDIDLSIVSPKGKSNRRQVIKRLIEKGLLRKHDSRSGIYRHIDGQVDVMNLDNVDPGQCLDLWWPFELEQYCRIYQQNIIVVAGSPNAGKTAFLLRFVAMNMHRPEIADIMPIEYFTSEMGEQELRIRRDMFGESEWSWNPHERSGNFSDCIRTDKINIIDYMEITDSFYKVAEELADIHNVLGRGVAVVALQKKKGAELGRGAEFSLEKPRLYLSMDNGELTIIKAKNWATKLNPNGKKWRFNLVNGAEFVNIREA